jgi:hypothetical protein
MIKELKDYVNTRKVLVAETKGVGHLEAFDFNTTRAQVNAYMFAIMIGAEIKTKDGKHTFAGFKSLPTDKQKHEAATIYKEYCEKIMEPILDSAHPAARDKMEVVDPETNLFIRYDPKIKEKDLAELILKKANINLDIYDFLSVNLMAIDISGRNWTLFWGILATVVITATGVMYYMAVKRSKEEKIDESTSIDDDVEIWNGRDCEDEDDNPCDFSESEVLESFPGDEEATVVLSSEYPVSFVSVRV